ncbi:MULTISPECIES: VOC family protein [Micrococcaceae]|uniref:VOC family protein n=1 Tax=unclassified Kocuria TaxID=2649579 RepID=UPI001EDD2E29|nr:MULTISPECIES: VOC family protein [unclassified Kocuria]
MKAAKTMDIVRKNVVFDASDIEAETSFWTNVLGGQVSDEDSNDPRWRDIVVDGEIQVSVQHAPDHIAPTWPAGEDDQHQQLHYDLTVASAEFEASCQEVLALGAHSLQEPRDLEAAHGFHVFADPAGHPFCICWG